MTLVKLETCPSCGSRNIQKFNDIKDHSISGEVFTVDECKDCKLKFTNPRPDEQSIGKYYESEEYVSHSDTQKGLINNLYHKVRSITVKQKVALINSLSDKLKILDIGCGTGYFIKACQEDGWKVDATEPDSKARTIAQQQIGKPIASSVFDLEDLNSYQIITMWHVLEHVHRLNETMIKINTLLNPKGKLIIAVPNPDSKDAKHYGTAWAAYDVPRHLYHFNRESMNVLLNKHNFKVIETKPMLFDSFYVSMMSEKYKAKPGNLISAFIHGLRSNIAAKFGNKNYSSIIYIAEKL